MGEERKNLVVYAVQSDGVELYVGQGTRGRAASHAFPRMWAGYGVAKRPEIVILHATASREEALQLEAFEISQRKPKYNKAKFSSTGGLLAWNKGTKGKSTGGRKPGTPMTAETKKKLSEALKGKSTVWLTGRRPWNYGLTKTDPRVAKGVETYAPKRQEAGVKIWDKRGRKNGP